MFAGKKSAQIREILISESTWEEMTCLFAPSLMDHSLNSLNNFDFLARSFARMHAEGRPVDILAVTGNMDEEHRTWFCARYAWYCQQMMQARELELEH